MSPRSLSATEEVLELHRGSLPSGLLPRWAPCFPPSVDLSARALFASSPPLRSMGFGPGGGGALGRRGLQPIVAPVPRDSHRESDKSARRRF
mmetsp:Transcript_16058/g.45715  ORF Transcript_16058/g.45715 Transcript_16058/m.45715 type:complete len:92 (+) Transcript_16058:320-595(+)